MPIESALPSIENNKKNEDRRTLVEKILRLREIVGRVFSGGDPELGLGVGNTVGSRRFDPTNQTNRATVVGDDTTKSATSDDPDD